MLPWLQLQHSPLQALPPPKLLLTTTFCWQTCAVIPPFQLSPFPVFSILPPVVASTIQLVTLTVISTFQLQHFKSQAIVVSLHLMPFSQILIFISPRLILFAQALRLSSQ